MPAEYKIRPKYASAPPQFPETPKAAQILGSPIPEEAPASPAPAVANKEPSAAFQELRRLKKLNTRLRAESERPRIKVSEAAMSLIEFCNGRKDLMVPSVWGKAGVEEDPYARKGSSGCCSVM